MADTDSGTQQAQPTPQTSTTSEQSGGGQTASGPVASADAVRAGAQNADPYRPGDTNDYSLEVDAGESSEATVANLYQAVPEEPEGNEVGPVEGDGASPDQATGVTAELGATAEAGPVETSVDAAAATTVQAAAAPDGADSAPIDDAAPAAGNIDTAPVELSTGDDGAQAAAASVGAGAGAGAGTGTGTGTGDTADDPIPNTEIGDLFDTDGSPNSFSEDAAAGSFVGLTGFALDVDEGDRVTYSINDSRFAIDPQTGVVTVAEGAEFDAETEPSITVEITATSSDGSSSTATFDFSVSDADEFDVGPVTDLDDTENAFAEDVAAGTQVGLTAFAEDADVTDSVSYSIDDPRFEIDPETGVVTIAEGAVFDAETEATLEVNVTATSTDGSTSTQAFTFTVTDVDDNDITPLSDTDASDNTVAENAAAGTVVGITAFASDADASDTVTYSITDDRFVIDAETGVVTVAEGANLDAETVSSIDLEVTATSTDGSSTSATFTITISDENEFGITPLSDTDASDNTVAENAAAGTVVGITAFASDADASDTVTYSITDDRFVIDAETGVVTVAEGANLDAETVSSIDLEVTATSTDGSSTSATFTITISDENEFGITPLSDTDASDNTVAENAAAGTVVGITAFASDADASDTVTYSITDDRFVIDAETGVVTVAEGANLDAETVSSIDLEVTATSTDGSSTSATFTINVEDGGDAPDLVVNEVGAREFVVNGSFETFTGTLGGSNGSGWYQNPDSVDGWTVENVDIHQAGHNNYGATDGGHHLDLASVTNGVASQVIEGQLDGHVYNLAMDLKSRGGLGQSVAKVYWNGELLDTIDPALTGADWQTFSFTVIGGSGDGSNTLTFVEVGSDNNGGTLIDSVSLTSSTTLDVAEEFEGAQITSLSVVDPDAGDTHSFTISDDRFEVVSDGGQYILKLKDNEAFDFEVESSVSVTVTVTDSTGLTDSETVVVNVIDVDESGYPVEALADVDASANVVAENSAAGTVVGVTAFADDPTTSDTVTYSISDSRFVIDANTGVVTVAEGANLDAETVSSIDLEVTATSSDGTSSSATFTVTISDENEFSIGSVSDIDATLNVIQDNAVAGTSVGISVFAEDLDATDTVSYTIDDARFVIDPVSGEVTVAEGAVFDSTNEPMISIQVTGTSSDGSSSVSSFQIAVNDPNVAPDLVVGEPAQRINYVKNGSFENFTSTGNDGGSGDALYYGDANVNDWVTVNTDIQTGGWSNLGTTDGDHRLDLADDHSNGYAYQDIQGLEAGLTYDLSVDLRDRGPAGDAIVEIYWGGELVARVDPALDGDGWNTYSFEVVGGAGAGNDRLTFREVGENNFKGTQIDNVVLTDSEGVIVAENDAGANIVSLSVVDPNLGDSHAFTVSDDRFEVVADGGGYMLKLKDGISLDYETEGSVTVNVTVTDDGGLSNTESINIRVVDQEGDPVFYGTEETIYVGETGSIDASNVLLANQGFEVSVTNLVAGSLTLGVLADLATDGGLIGVSGDVTGLLDGNQIGYDTLHGASEQFSVSFYEDVSQATVSVSNFYSDNLGVDCEVGHWYTFNDGQFVEAGTFLGTFDGTTTVDIDTSALFDQIVFTADVDTLGLGGSDFSISEIVYTDADLTVGGNDTLTGTSGNDTIYGLSGQDTIYGMDGDDLIVGGTRDDILFGGDGSDVFSYAMGDGNDTVYGGAGGSWIDIIDLNDGGTVLGDYGTDWNVTVTSGTINNVDMMNGEITLSDDAAGYIDLNDGARIEFTDIESIQF
ncbi:beta strand repeat-containing protein [Roseibium sp.]|uniref:beta strand repeat-containing protein n=1 Tax=Roseibium sp. TaxID=1936156 RepID=UPI003A97352C